MASLLEYQELEDNVISAVLKEIVKSYNAKMVEPSIAFAARFNKSIRDSIFARYQDGRIDEVSFLLTRIRCFKRHIFEGVISFILF